MIAVLRLDRAFRRVLETLTMLVELRELGVGFVAVKDPIDTINPVGRVALTMMVAVAEQEREMIRTRVPEGQERARVQEKRLGRPVWGSMDKIKRKRRKN